MYLYKAAVRVFICVYIGTRFWKYLNIFLVKERIHNYYEVIGTRDLRIGTSTKISTQWSLHNENEQCLPRLVNTEDVYVILTVLLISVVENERDQ